MEEIKIIGANKIASVEDAPIIVCGNSDYVVVFTFDDEWASKNKKTAHFVYYQDGLKKNIPVEFEGNTCNVPVLVNTEQVTIGVSADGMVTTTGAEVRCKKSILCEVDKEEADLFELGKKSVPNLLEHCQQLGYGFYNAVFTDSVFAITIPEITNLTGCFQGATGIEKLTIKGNTKENLVNFSSALRSGTLITVDLTEFNVKISNASNMCNGAKALKELKGIIDLTECTNVTSMFSNCNALEEVRFKANSISLSISFANSSALSSETVQSIIDGLATVETAQTLSLHSTVSSALTSEQMTQIVSKNWQLT